MRLTPAGRLLHYRVLDLQNIRTGYEPHQEAIDLLGDRPPTKLVHDAARIDSLVWRYRRQISGELWPVPTRRGSRGPRSGGLVNA
jgi:hypothetical protein